MMTSDQWDVVEVPFPFVDSEKTKMRKAVVLSPLEFQSKNGVMILAMITSAERSAWYLDVGIENLKLAGLKKACLVRMKLFTLDCALVAGRVGSLSKKDVERVRNSLSALKIFA